MMEKQKDEIRRYDDASEKKMTELQNMYVTTKDIDDVINRLSYTISEAINIALEI